MRALVIGANGFVGSRLVDRLLKEGRSVKAFVKEGTDLSLLLTKRKKVEIFKGDITRSDSFKEAFREAEVVFNCAAVLPHHRAPEKVYWQVNVDGVKNILAACKEAKVRRLVHMSTVGIYGSTGKRTVTENSAPRPPDIYAKTKLEGEKLVWKYIKDGFEATIVKPTIAYGPGDTRPGFLNLFSLIKKGLFIRVGRGDNFFHTIHIDNLVDGLLLAATKKTAAGEDFIIGDDPCPKMKDVVATIEKVTNSKALPFYMPLLPALLAGRFFDLAQKAGLPAPLTTQRLRFITENRKYSIKKAKKLLGYKPKFNLEEGMKKTFEWYKANGYIQ